MDAIIRLSVRVLTQQTRAHVTAVRRADSALRSQTGFWNRGIDFAREVGADDRFNIAVPAQVLTDRVLYTSYTVNVLCIHNI